MRAGILKHWQISIALVFSLALVAGSYLFARGVITPQVAQASAETALLQAIANKDADHDGLPDWQETLYGTDPHISDTFHIGMNDGEAVAKGLIVPKAVNDVSIATSTPSSADYVDPSLPPAPANGTLTALFAQNFFTLYMTAREANGGADLSESQMSDVANQSVQMITSSIKPAPDYKAMSDLTISGSGPDAMKSFAASVELILKKNTSDATTTDINYLKSAVMDGDTTANEHLLSIAKGFRSSAAGIAAIPVPTELAQADLLLINTFMRMSQLDVDFTKSDSDPLVAILALQQYETVTRAMLKAFTNIGAAFAAAYVTLPSGAPGASFVNMTADIKRAQANKKS